MKNNLFTTLLLILLFLFSMDLFAKRPAWLTNFISSSKKIQRTYLVKHKLLKIKGNKDPRKELREEIKKNKQEMKNERKELKEEMKKVKKVKPAKHEGHNHEGHNHGKADMEHGKKGEKGKADMKHGKKGEHKGHKHEGHGHGKKGHK